MSSTPTYDALSLQRQAFVDSFVTHGNATQAAKDAKYSERTAYAQGHRLLKVAEVDAAIEERRAARAQRTEIDQDRVVLEIGRLAFSDVRKLFGPNGQLKRIEELDDATAAAVASVKVVTRRVPGSGDDDPEVEYVHEYKFWDKGAAQDKLMRHLGGYERDNDQRDPLKRIPDAFLDVLAGMLAGD